jgi:integrase
MPPPRTGSVEPFKRADGSTYYRARIRHLDGFRERVDVPEKFSRPAGGKTGEERAELYAMAAQEREDETHDLYERRKARLADEAKQRDPGNGETCTKYFERLSVHRKELGRRGGKDDESTWNVWLKSRIGTMPIAKVGRDDVERVRDALDEAIALHKRTGGKEGVGHKRARNVWTVVTSTFKAACMAKRRDLRVREDNPCTGVLPPERGESRRRTFVYPVEVSALLACGEVPLEWRELYALACYLYLRPGELRALTVGDVDLDAQVVHVSKAFDERSGEVKPPKTRNGIRDVPIHPNLAPLLARLCEGKESPDALLAPLLSALSAERYAIHVRKHLATARVTRPRLTENSPTTMHVGFRSWRDTGITWLALAGVDVAKMQRRAGHDHISTTMGYVKAAEDITGAIGVPFPKLPEGLVKPKRTGGSGGGGERAKRPRLGQVAHLHGKILGETVAPSGLEPEHPFGLRILNAPIRRAATRNARKKGVGDVATNVGMGNLPTHLPTPPLPLGNLDVRRRCSA